MSAPLLVKGEPVSARAMRLASRDRADHPAAVDVPCSIHRAHTPHPWGPLAPAEAAPVGSLTRYCPGRDT